MKCDLNPPKNHQLLLFILFSIQLQWPNDDNRGRTKEQDSRMTDSA